MQRWKKIPYHRTIVEILDIILLVTIVSQEERKRKRNRQARVKNVSTNSNPFPFTDRAHNLDGSSSQRRVIVVMYVKEEGENNNTKSCTGYIYIYMQRRGEWKLSCFVCVERRGKTMPSRATSLQCMEHKSEINRMFIEQLFQWCN